MTATAGNGSVTLNWSGGTGAATYNVLRAEGLLGRPKVGPDDPVDPQWGVRSRDTRGRNVGKWMPRYRLRDYAA